MTSDKKVLLTGATGFVGTSITPVLREAGWEVIPARRDEYLDRVRGCEAVVHLAGRTHILAERASDSAALYRRDNVELSLGLARSAASAGVNRLIFVSTAKVFGEGRETPYMESDPPGPQDDYARSKLAAEMGLFEIARETGIEVVILRPPLVYGPGVRANFLSLLRAVDRGLPLPLGAVRNRRSLVSVANLASAVVTVLSHPEASGKIFPVSDGEDVSTPDLIRMLAAALERPVRVLPVPIPLLRVAGAISGKGATIDRLTGNLVVDSSALRELGWKPPQSLGVGLEEVALWYRAVHRP